MIFFFFSTKNDFCNIFGAGLAPPEPLSPTSAPGGDETPTPPATGEAPTSTTGSRAGATPSAAHRVSPLHLVAVLAAIALKHY